MVLLLAMTGIAGAQPAPVEKLLRAKEWPSARGILAAVRGYWPELILALDHEDPGVRVRAAEALGLARYRPAEKPLMNRIPSERPDIAYAQLRALLDITRPRNRGKHGEPLDAGVSGQELADLGPSMTPLLIRTLQDEEDIGEIGYPVCLALGILNDPAAIPALIFILDGRMDWAYFGAVEALAKFEDSRVAPALARNLTKDFGSDFVNPAAGILLSMGDKGFQGVAQVLRESKDESTRANCAYLMRYADYRWAPVLRGALSDRSRSVREAVEASLTEMYRRHRR